MIGKARSAWLLAVFLGLLAIVSAGCGDDESALYTGLPAHEDEIVPPLAPSSELPAEAPVEAVEPVEPIAEPAPAVEPAVEPAPAAEPAAEEAPAAEAAPETPAAATE